jgi:hypothetical protein
LWHGADAYYERKANNKKADEGMITFSEAFWRGTQKTTYEKKSTRNSIEAFLKAGVCHEQMVYITCVEDEVWGSKLAACLARSKGGHVVRCRLNFGSL